jgi:Domain of unknown function (DUF4395)
MSFELECPVDFKKVNENKVRLTALWVLAVVVLFIYTQWNVLIALLVVDFTFRAFEFGAYSLLNKLSDVIIFIAKISSKPIDQAPKLFATKIGLLFAIAILGSTYTEYKTATIVLSSILIFFAFLESFLGFCAGCYVYTFYQKIFKYQQ